MHLYVFSFVRFHDTNKQERVTPTLIKNYGLLYRAFNRLDVVKMFVMRIETSFILLNRSDQAVIEKEARRTVNHILAATNLKNWHNQQFFMLTAGSGEEQDKQVKYMRELVRTYRRVCRRPTVENVFPLCAYFDVLHTYE